MRKFFSEQIEIIKGEGTSQVYAADLDLDGDGDVDVDVLAASSDDDKIVWYENKGQGVFGEQRAITTAVDMATSVYAADLDNDGDMDVLSASFGDDKIAWYRNERVTGISEGNLVQNLPKEYLLFPNYPNPFNLSTRFTRGLPVESRVRLEVYDVDGKKVGVVLEGKVFSPGIMEYEWNAVDERGYPLPTGVYFVRMEAEPVHGGKRFEAVEKMVLMK